MLVTIINSQSAVHNTKILKYVLKAITFELNIQAYNFNNVQCIPALKTCSNPLWDVTTCKVIFHKNTISHLKVPSKINDSNKQIKINSIQSQKGPPTFLDDWKICKHFTILAIRLLIVWLKKCQYILAHSYAEQCPQFFLVADLAVSSKTDN